MKYSYKTLSKIAPEVTEKIVRFSLDRYGHDEEWRKRIWERLSFEGIARRYFKEYVNSMDEKEPEKNKCPLTK